jgi:hypothetical protein
MTDHYMGKALLRVKPFVHSCVPMSSCHLITQPSGQLSALQPIALLHHSTWQVPEPAWASVPQLRTRLEHQHVSRFNQCLSTTTMNPTMSASGNRDAQPRKLPGALRVIAMSSCSNPSRPAQRYHDICMQHATSAGCSHASSMCRHAYETSRNKPPRSFSWCQAHAPVLPPCTGAAASNGVASCHLVIMLPRAGHQSCNVLHCCCPAQAGQQAQLIPSSAARASKLLALTSHPPTRSPLPE